MTLPMLASGPESAQRLRHGVAAHGFAALDDLLPAETLSALQAEAHAEAAAAVSAAHDAYRSSIATLGPLAVSVLFGDAFLDLLHAAAGTQVAANAERSCLTIYRPGDYLGPHLDNPEEECWFTAILYLEARSAPAPDGCTGLELRVYREEKPTADTLPQLIIPTMAGRLVVGRGAQVWHERPVLQTGEQVMALTACYRRA